MQGFPYGTPPMTLPGTYPPGHRPATPAPGGGAPISAGGLSFEPMPGVTPPAAAGGPHPLPPLPHPPIPRGLPNPFEIQQLSSVQPGQVAPFSPGSVTVTGPAGHLPAWPAGLPGPSYRHAEPQGDFWQHLAWQLLGAPSVRQALGARFGLLTGPERARTLAIAVACLTGPQMQAAFRALTGGLLDQVGFTHQFALALQASLRAAGML